ncbi:MAG TPA: hypothetical protein VMN39_02625 [Longimicrobiaceae bacterium]|nr:hypothetical protein [Longimicrobiaceae bacterium]
MSRGLVLLLLLAAPALAAQDTSMVQGGIYQRPFLVSAGRTAVGGYAEGHGSFFRTDGVGEGLNLELRRFNIFLFSSAGRRLRFMSELEFEHGTEEIVLETALVDFQINPALTIRAGILLPPIGAFNQNHDSPLWAFVERPLVSTEIIPATLSEIGFGVNGKLFRAPVLFTYDLYLTNGLGDGVVANDQGRTHLPAGRREEQFAEDNNGSPALSGRLAARHMRRGELGLSFYTAQYNTSVAEGEEVDAKRRATLLAVDYAADLPLDISARGEAALAFVDVPEDLAEVFGERQWGAFLDVEVPVWRPAAGPFDAAEVSGVVRFEAIDYNVGTFGGTGRRIRDEVYAVVAGVSFRPVPGTVLRLNYRRHWIHDLLGNPPARAAGVQVGFASYF